MLDVMLTLDSKPDIIKNFKVDETCQSMTFGETIHGTCTMLEHAPDEIAGDADIQNAVGLVGHKIYVGGIHRANMKDVDGRDKPGHDSVQ